MLTLTCAECDGGSSGGVGLRDCIVGSGAESDSRTRLLLSAELGLPLKPLGCLTLSSCFLTPLSTSRRAADLDRLRVSMANVFCSLSYIRVLSDPNICTSETSSINDDEERVVPPYRKSGFEITIQWIETYKTRRNKQKQATTNPKRLPQ